MTLSTWIISKKHGYAIAALVAVGVVGAMAILGGGKGAEEEGHAHGHGASEHPARAPVDEHGNDTSHAGHETHDEPVAQGSHGGQWLTDGPFAAEVVMGEDAGQAHLRVWLTHQGKAVTPGSAQVTVTLSRPDGERQTVAMVPAQGALQGAWVSAEPVAEPHAFDATIEVQTAQGPHRFSYSLQEGRVVLSDEQVRAAGILIESASSASIRSSLRLPGEIRFNEDRTAHVVPRVAGVVERVHVSLGQRVRKGDVLAVISSASVSEQRSELLAAHKREQLARATYERENSLWEEKISPRQDVLQAEQALREAEIAVANARQKLQALGVGGSSGSRLNRFELRVPFDGDVVEKHLVQGEMVKEDANVFTVSDLSSVWAEIDVSAKDLAQVRVNKKVTVHSGVHSERADGLVSYVGALLGEGTRTAKARVTLPNRQGFWRPGLFVDIELITDEAVAAVTVSSHAVQQVDGHAVVFIRVPGGFLPQPVRLGRRDGSRIEVLQGLKGGTPHAAVGSFVVKAEAGKGSATHTH